MKKNTFTNYHGNMSLTLAFSTAAGVFFSMLYFNLSGYLGAQGALQEAVRKTARCVVPSDPECSTVDVLGGTPLEQEWYGFPSGSISNRVAVTLDYYRYSAALTNLVWGANYDTFMQHRAIQPLEWTSYAVPQRQFTARLNDYEIPRGIMRATYEDPGLPAYSSRFEPNFPTFEQDERQTPAVWLSRQPVPYNLVSLPRVRISSGTQREFTFGPYSVLAVDSRPGVACTNSAGTICDVGPLAGASVSDTNWKNFAWVAIKLFSQVRAVNRSAQVKWGEIPSGPGLWIDIRNPDGSLYKSAPVCLGGSSYSDVLGRNFEGYNLWLRGPAGANGGESAVCPPTPEEPGGKLKHDNIAVPRGGSFTVRAILKTSASRGAAEADVSIAYYIDEYNRREPIPTRVDCNEKPFEGPDSSVPCISRSECVPGGLSEAYQMISCSKDVTERVPTCSASVVTVPVTTVTNSSNIVTAAVCNDSWRPSTVSIPSGRTQCGWDVENTGSVTVAKVPANCSLASAETTQATCDKDLIYSRTPNMQTHCSTPMAKMNELTATTTEVNSSQPTGAVTFEGSVNYRMLPQTGDHWQFSWSPTDTEWGELSLEKNEVTRVEHTLGDAGFIRKLKRTGNSQDKPVVTDFVNAIKNEMSTYGTNGLDAYSDKVSNYVRPILAKEEALPVTGLYPFTEAVAEIPWGQNGRTKGWDFNRDCHADNTCSSGVQFSTLEEAMRHFASSIIPQAADSSYEFIASENYSHTNILNAHTTSEASNLSLASCTPTKMICSSGITSLSVPVLLGNFNEAPASCGDGTYNNCYSRTVGVTTPTLEVNNAVDSDKARSLGLNEFRRIVPFAKDSTQCATSSEPGCLSLTVDVSNETANVQATYNMPLTFPLDTILGSDSIPISISRNELLEKAMLRE